MMKAFEEYFCCAELVKYSKAHISYTSRNSEHRILDYLTGPIK